MKLFGSETCPVRASRLPALLRCPLNAVLEMLGENSSGPAADTGSAVHKAAAAYHTTAKRDVAASLAEMRTFLPEYPLADLGTAEQQFRHYAADPRNQEANVVLCEAKVTVVLSPPEGDTTPIEIHGRLDQVREYRGVLTVYDIKTGGVMEGDEMLSYAAAQLAAYQVGASELLGKRVASACIIRTKDYLKTGRKKTPKPGPVFWSASWVYEDAVALMEEVRRIVGEIRRGHCRVSPSAENCRYCPGAGVANCLGRRRALTLV